MMFIESDLTRIKIKSYYLFNENKFSNSSTLMMLSFKTDYFFNINSNFSDEISKMLNTLKFIYFNWELIQKSNIPDQSPMKIAF